MRLGILLLTVFILICDAVAQQPGTFIKKQFVLGGDTLPYRLLYPLDYNSDKKYPLVLFLHGAGSWGSDNEKPLKSLPAIFLDSANRRKYPCFILVPQCTKEEPWVRFPDFPKSVATPDTPTTSTKLTLKLIAALKKDFPIRQNKIYITGLSLGGEGTFDFLSRAPRLFAAAIPICGIADTARAKTYQKVRLWAFHGDEDKVNDVKYTRMIIASLKKAGGKPKYTEYKGVKHNSWINAYAEPTLLDWLFRK
ncbi:MAG: alpha/beta hydrolase-fold protein [Pseudobacter sp.]|uniref:carboxylesterase family protein n=1 Tax=Pseudobacter sp. TaxID=2045420 RepID=UPI003F810473